MKNQSLLSALFHVVLWALVCITISMALAALFGGCATYSDALLYHNQENTVECNIQTKTDTGILCVQVSCSRVDGQYAPAVRTALCATDRREQIY